VDEGRFYHRIASRLFSTLAHHTWHGSLYRVREQSAPAVVGPSPMITLRQLLTRLSGAKSPRDLIALVGSRVICGDEQVRDAVERGIRDALFRRVDPGQLAEDVAAIRRLRSTGLLRSTGPRNDPFGLLHGPGGLLDLRLLARYLVVRYAHEVPRSISGETLDCFETLAAAGAISAEELRALADATRMQRAIRDMLGLASEGGITIHEAPGALREKLAVALQYDSPEALEEGYGSARERVFGIFQDRVELKSG